MRLIFSVYTVYLAYYLRFSTFKRDEMIERFVYGKKDKVKVK